MHFKVDEHVLIPVAGCQLAARIWLPDNTDQVPAILEYIPYGKRSGTRQRDDPMHGRHAIETKTLSAYACKHRSYQMECAELLGVMTV